jgi:5-methylcytosine-specific restriction endonuclease McrA
MADTTGAATAKVATIGLSRTSSWATTLCGRSQIDGVRRQSARNRPANVDFGLIVLAKFFIPHHSLSIMTTTPKQPPPPRRTQGMNFVRQTTRLAIYLRDGLACAYCGQATEDGAQLTLDHLRPYSRGGTNAPTNLVTCCQRCNSGRGNRPVATFARSVAAYLGHAVSADEIVAHVRRTARRVLPREQARELVAARGSVARVLAKS